MRLAGIEPARPKARDFKSLVSTYFTTVALIGVPPGTRTPTNGFGDRYAAITLGIHILGGSGEIRTHGPFLIVCFQDRCNKPDSATLPYYGAPSETRTRTLAHWLLRPACLPIPPKGHKLYISKHISGIEPLRLLHYVRKRMPTEVLMSFDMETLRGIEPRLPG